MSGEGVQYHVPVSKMRKVRVNLSPRQALVLRKGGAITIKAITDNGTHEISLPEIDIKKLMTKLQKGSGGRVTLNGGSVESMFRDAARWAAPVANAAQDRAIREIGRGMAEDVAKKIMMGSMAKQPKYMSAVVDKRRNPELFAETLGKGIKKRGRPRKGKGMFDFLDPKKNGADRFFTQTLPNNLVDVGLPIAIGAIGSAAGSATGNPLLGMAGSYAGKQAGEAAARRIRKSQGRGVLTDLATSVAKQVAKHVAKKAVSYAGKKARQGANYLVDRAEAGANEMIGDGIMPAGVGKGILPAGVNLRRGSGLGQNAAPIQTGSPYLQIGAPGWKPYVPSQNPFATNTMVGRATKGSGMIVRV